MRKALSLLTTLALTLPLAVGAGESYTAKVKGTKVRMRSSPDLEGAIVRELAQGDLVLVTGESNGFCAIALPKDVKAYVYRTFVYDNTIDGKNVNVRLAPDTEATIVAQLSTGDKVVGEPCSQNPKWIEIAPPANAKFYVAAELIEKIGGPEIYTTHERRAGEVARHLNSAYIISLSELRKGFGEIHMDRVTQAFEKVIEDYADFPSYVERAQRVLAMAQDLYVQKKLAFLEEKTQLYPSDQGQLAAEFENYYRTVHSLREELAREHIAFAGDLIEEEHFHHPIAHRVYAAEEHPTELYPQVGEIGLVEAPRRRDSAQRAAFITDKMRAWQPVEDSLYHLWALERGEGSLEQFYADEALEAKMVSGLLESYNRPIANRPGDYLLKVDNRPVAFLYSTRVNLEDYLGQQIRVKVVPRPNHNFAFPAYYVVAVE
ncbi:MAG: SH3 domain-containing protein [Parachlamydiales bacterium]